MAATATLVSHAHRSLFEVIAKSPDVVVCQHGTLDVAEYRQPVPSIDRTLVQSNGFDPQTGAVWNQFKLCVRCDPQRDAQRFRDYHPSHSVDRHVHTITLPLKWQNGRQLPLRQAKSRRLACVH
jgi:hypothetical protein